MASEKTDMEGQPVVEALKLGFIGGVPRRRAGTCSRRIALSPASRELSQRESLSYKTSKIPFPDKFFPAVLRLPLWGSSAQR